MQPEIAIDTFPESEDASRCMLGKTILQIEEEFGQPFLSYSYRDSLIYIYSNDDMTMIEFRENLVSKIGQCRERRAYRRVTPVSDILVYISGHATFSGLMMDISVPSIAVRHSTPYPSMVGEKVRVVCGLPMRGTVFPVSIAGTVYRSVAENGGFKTVIKFTDPMDSEPRLVVSHYIQQRLADLVVGLLPDVEH